MEKQTITFLTWPSKTNPDWVMVHPCKFTTWAGTLAFPGGPSTNGEVVNFRELAFPVLKARLTDALRLYVHDFLKISEYLPLNVEARGSQGDYVVTYVPKADKDLPEVKNPDWKNHLDLFQQAALDMADETEKLRREYGSGGDHPDWPRTEWQLEVGNLDTQLGYWEWVVHRVQSEIRFRNVC